MRIVAQNLVNYANSAEIVDWLCVWAALSVFAFFVLPYGPYEDANVVLHTGFTLGVAAGITFLMAGTLYLFKLVSQLFFATKAALASLVVAAFFAPYLSRITAFSDTNNEIAEFRNFLMIFGLCIGCYCWLWSLQTYRAKYKTPNEEEERENLFSQHEMLHVQSQGNSIKVATIRGTEIWDFPMEGLLSSLQELGGLRVHTDHWVSDNAVQGYGRNTKGEMVLALINRTFVPVNETYAKQVAARYQKL